MIANAFPQFREDIVIESGTGVFMMQGKSWPGGHRSRPIEFQDSTGSREA